MEKLYCISVKNTGADKRIFYLAALVSSYGFIQDCFINRDLFHLLKEEITQKGFVDVTDYFHLQYDKRLDKLVYTLNK